MSDDAFPIEDGHDDATDEARLDGMVEQVRADYLLGSSDDALGMLRLRLADAGITVTDEKLTELAVRVSA